MSHRGRRRRERGCAKNNIHQASVTACCDNTSPSPLCRTLDMRAVVAARRNKGGAGAAGTAALHRGGTAQQGALFGRSDGGVEIELEGCCMVEERKSLLLVAGDREKAGKSAMSTRARRRAGARRGHDGALQGILDEQRTGKVGEATRYCWLWSRGRRWREGTPWTGARRPWEVPAHKPEGGAHMGAWSCCWAPAMEKLLRGVQSRGGGARAHGRRRAGDTMDGRGEVLAARHGQQREGGRDGCHGSSFSAPRKKGREHAGRWRRHGKGRAELLASCAPAMEEKLLLAAVWEEAEGCGGCKRIGVGVKNGQGQRKGSIFIDAC
jgi:hypothetical protein